ncbi:hypothetical protein ES705_48836 [subsurface metagenome]
MGRIEIDPSRHRRKINQKEVKEIIEESKTNFREIIGKAFEAEAGITEFEFFLLTVLHDIRGKLSEIEKVIT